MANAEETPNTDIIFRGIDGNECEAFIVAIRDLAYAKGKDEDPNWMLRYATTRLRGKALRWHLKLDPAIRKDWDLFTQALCEEYPFVEEGEEGGIATPVWTSTTFSPTPSTATLPSNDRQIITPSVQPSTGTARVSARSSQSTDLTVPEAGEVATPRIYDPSLPGLKMGRLLVVYEEDPPGRHYVSASSKRTTSNIEEALIVTFIPSSEPHSIGCINSSEPKLGVRLSWPSQPIFCPLIGGQYSDSQVRVHRSYTQDLSSIWEISSDGTLNAKLPYLVPDPGNKAYSIPSEYSLKTAVYVDIAGATVSFVVDDSTPPTTHPTSGLPVLRARILFEPL